MYGADRSVLVRLRADISDFQRKFATAGGEVGAFVRRLDQADSRMANLVQTGLALAPAFVPIGALAIPAVAGLSSQLGLAATSAGVALLAFQGVGDALKALNDYQIDPTAAHLQKLDETMNALGPAGQIFVRALQDLRPAMQDLQDVAQAGLFPGLTDSIHELIGLQPEVEHIIGTISTAMGDLAAEGAHELTDQRWVDFIHFLDTEARPTLTAMSKTLGYIVEGFASLMMDFDPLADDFTQGMVGYAKAFRDWADGLSQTDGFEDFVDYIRTNGPEALDTLGALVGALVSLVSAAAPVGSAVLPVIEALANGLSAIADSDVGPALITAAAAVGTLGRALALLRAVGLRGDGNSILGQALNVESIKTAIPAMAAYDTAVAEMAAAESEAAAAHARYIGALKANSVAMELVPGREASEHMVQVTNDLVAANDRQAAAAKKVEEAEARKSETVRRSLSGLARAAGVVGGLAFATSGYSDKVGLANTATYAMLGMIAGPWGAAVGAGIGLMQDFAAANDDAEQAIRRAHRAMADGTDIGEMQSSLADLNAQISQLNENLSLTPSWDPISMATDNIAFAKSAWDELFHDTSEKLAETRDELQQTSDDMLLGVNALGRALGDLEVGTFVDDVDQLAPVLERAQPALDALGISVADLGDAVADGSILDLTRQIVGYLRYADSAEGRTQALADSMSEMNDDMVSTADAADALAKSLDDLFGPALNLSSATDQWADGLDHLKENLDKTGRSLQGQTDAARTNREAIRDQVTNLVDLLKAQADAGDGAGKLARQMRSGKQAILDAAEAAGLGRKETAAYLHQLGLTPKMVKTIIEANTDPAERKQRALMEHLKKLDQYKATPQVDANTSEAMKKIAAVRSALSALASAGNQIHVALGGMKFARGGRIVGPGTKTSDSVPVMASTGEFMMSAAAVDHYGVDTMFAMNARRLAAGGPTSDSANTSGGYGRYASTGAGGTPAFALVGPAHSLAILFGNIADQGKRELTIRQRLLDHEIDRDRKEVDLAKQHYDAVQQDIASLRESIATRFKSDLFTHPDAPNLNLQMPTSFDSIEAAQAWYAAQQQAIDFVTQGDSPTDILKQDLNDISHAKKLFRRLKKAGLHGAALQYVEEQYAAGNADDSQLTALLADPKLLKRYQRLYGQRDRAAGQLGQMVAMQRWGDDLHAARKELEGARKQLHTSNSELREVNKRLHHLEQLAEKNPKETGDKVGDKVNGASAAGARGRVIGSW